MGVAHRDQPQAPALAAVHDHGRGVHEEAVGAVLLGAAQGARGPGQSVEGHVMQVDGDVPGAAAEDPGQVAVQGIDQAVGQPVHRRQVGIQGAPGRLVTAAEAEALHHGRQGRAQGGDEQDQVEQGGDGDAGAERLPRQRRGQAALGGGADDGGGDGRIVAAHDRALQTGFDLTDGECRSCAFPNR